jgi:hypothetical protein
MRAPISLVFMTSLAFAAATVVPAWPQDRPAMPPSPEVSIKPIGKVLNVTGTVTIEHGNAVPLQASLGGQTPGGTKVNDPVYLGDIVLTASNGKIGIGFTDGTAFNLSSNARMVLNEFVYDPNGHSNSTLFSLTKGTFTFVAGNIAKTGDMKIDTPVATMGIRGTTPHVEISDNGTVKFSTLLEDGKAEVVQKNRAPGVGPAGSGGSAPPREKLNLNICRGC